MAAVRIQGVTKQFGPQIVFESVTLELLAGQTVGLVGANGAGKTTLFRLIAGEFPPDVGTVTRARGLEIGFLKQEPDVVLERTLHDEVGSVFADLLALEQRLHDVSHAMAGSIDGAETARLMEQYDRINAQFITAGGHTFETRLREILGGLGFVPADYDLPMAVLSGGQKCRAALAKLLLRDPEFLLLDEPTNHLDIDAVGWLEKFLAGHHGGAVIISHDRYLLDRLCDRIVEVAQRSVSGFPGNYSNYVKTRDLRALTVQRQLQKDAEFIRKEREFIAKHLAGQRSKEAQGRRTRLERRLAAGEFVTEGPARKRSARIEFDEAEPRQGTTLRCDELAMRFDDHVLFTDLTFQVQAGERFGITGPNGTGKSTLLRIILGQVSPTAGSVSLDRRCAAGYYAQESTDLDPNRTMLDEVRSHRPDLSEQTARSILGAYLFTGNNVFKTLGMLSGGEQSRVRLATLILSGPDVLILDEPTNHLDIPSREVLEDALLDFPGTIVVVSHDRYFLDRIVDRLLVIRPAGHAIYAGNYSFYVSQVEQQRAAAKAAVDGKIDRKPDRKRGTKSTSPGPRSAYDHLGLEALEALIMQREGELAVINERFGDPAVYKDGGALTDLRKQAEQLGLELAVLNAAWHDRAEAN